MAVAKPVGFCMLQNLYCCVSLWLSLTTLFPSGSGVCFSTTGAMDFGIFANKFWKATNRNFFPFSAIYWNKTPPANVKGILGENVTLGWNFTISSAETLDYFVLLRSSDDMIRYDHSKGEVTIFENFKGRVAMSVDGSPKFVLFNLQGKDDKAKFCLKVYTKIKSTGHARSYWPTPKCAKIELLGKVSLCPLLWNELHT